MIIRTLLPLFVLFGTAVSAGFDPSVCDSTKHCVSVPANCHKHANEQCDYIVAYAPTEDGKNVEIELVGMKPGSDYVALGFSEDENMGNDAVTGCMKSPDGPPKLVLAFNPGKFNQKLESWSENDAKLLDSYSDDKSIYCKFLQPVVPANDKLPDFDKSYQLIVATGPRSGDGLGYHSAAQAIPDFVDFMTPIEPPVKHDEVKIPDADEAAAPQSVPGGVHFGNETNGQGPADNSNGQDRDQPKVTEESISTKPAQRGSGPFSLKGSSKLWLVRFHGLFMLIGWFAMVGIAIFSARYLRGAMPDHKIGRLHTWFLMHRTINILAVLLIVAAALMVFTAKDLTWTGPMAAAPSDYNLGSGALHSLFGVMAVILSLLQPLFAFCRCGPDHPKRPMFNWGHRFFGLTAILFALIAASIAVFKFSSLWSTQDWHMIVLILYVVIAALIIVALEVYDVIRLKRRQNYSINAYELQNRGKSRSDVYEANYMAHMHERQAKDKCVNLIGYCLFVAVSITAVVFLGIFLM